LEESIYRLPIALFVFQRRHTEELVYGVLGIILFDLLCIVVFILDPNVAGFIVIRSLVLKIISTTSSAIGNREVKPQKAYSSSPESCMKSSSSDMLLTLIKDDLKLRKGVNTQGPAKEELNEMLMRDHRTKRSLATDEMFTTGNSELGVLCGFRGKSPR
jgi:hypothetical protein